MLRLLYLGTKFVFKNQKGDSIVDSFIIWGGNYNNYMQWWYKYPDPVLNVAIPQNKKNVIMKKHPALKS